MNRLFLVIALFVFGLATAGETKTKKPARDDEVKPMPPPAREEILLAMGKATRFMMSISTEGGYLWSYSPDLKTRAGKNYASPTQIWIQQPGGTPGTGKAFLNAYEATKDPLCLEAARGVVNALAKCQLPSGCWSFSGDFDPKHPNIDGVRTFQGDEAAVGKNSDNPHYYNASTFEDHVASGPILFLMDFLDAAGQSNDPRDAVARVSLDRALNGMLRAQYPNGAWPERYNGKPRNPDDYPVKKATIPADYPRTWPDLDYTGSYTLNNDVQRDCVLVMLEAFHRYGKQEYFDAAKKGADFTLFAQLPEPQPGWAQQYDFAMQPTWGRVMEMPAVSPCESRSAFEVLLTMYLETGEEKYLTPIPPALDWLKKSTIGSNRWARYYELKTNRPVYGGLDGAIHYDKAEARPGYSWEGSFRIPEFIAVYEEVKTKGREDWLASHKPDVKPSEVVRAERLIRWNESERDVSVDNLGSKAAQIVGQLDDQGRWISKYHYRKFSEPEDMISTKVYVDNMNLLGRYLKLTEMQ